MTTSSLFIVLLSAFIFLPNDSFEADPRKKLSVVLFFAKVDPSCMHLEEESCSLKRLDFHEKTRVKHSSDTTTHDEKSEEKTKTSVHCNELLKDSLMDLTHFCHTVLEMKTAIASVTSKELTNDIQEPESHSNSFKTSRSFRKTRGTKMKFKKKKHPIEETIPSLNSEKSHIKNIIKGPKHTEVFKIRLRRSSDSNPEVNDARHLEVEGFPLRKTETKPKWDVLDIVQHVRYSFLEKMFNNDKADEINKEENCNLGLDKLGTVEKDHGLFEVVRSTLKTVEEEPETGFFMVVFGGDLIDINKDHSALVQSIKYVTENTDLNNTLIIVTGSCPDHHEGALDRNGENPVVHIGGHFDDQRKISRGSILMPVFAKGPHSDMLKECNLLYDVPLTVRKILEKSRGSTFSNPDGNLWQRSDTHS